MRDSFGTSAGSHIWKDLEPGVDLDRGWPRRRPSEGRGVSARAL